MWSKIINHEDWCRIFHYKKSWVQLHVDIICLKCQKKYRKVQINKMTLIERKK